MRRVSRNGWAFLGFAAALVLSVAGLVRPHTAAPSADRVVMIGIRGLSWQVVIDRIEQGGLPTLAGLIDDGAAVGDIIADGYGSEEEILASIATGRLPHKQPAAPLWEELRLQGCKVAVSGFPSDSSLPGPEDGESAVRLLREEPDRHLFLYIAGVRGAGGEPIIRGYDMLDDMLRRMMEADGGRSTFMLFSEAGNPEGRVDYKPYFPELEIWPAFGFFMVWGNHAKGSTHPHMVAPVDLAPTLLHVGGVKIPNDMDGLVLFQVFDDGFYHKRRLAFRP